LAGDGEKTQNHSCQFLIMATGCLSTSKIPDFRGIETFKGKIYRTSKWPHENIDFTGQRVACIGTGSSGIQAIPVIAAQAEHLTVFQRTPNYSVPAHNHPLDPISIREAKDNYPLNRKKARESIYGFYSVELSPKPMHAVLPDDQELEISKRWNQGGFQLVGSFSDLVFKKEANDRVAEFVREKIREIVKDPNVAEILQPRDYPLGTKRLCIDTNYYATFNRENVKLVDLKKTPIHEFTPNGLKTSAE